MEPITGRASRPCAKATLPQFDWILDWVSPVRCATRFAGFASMVGQIAMLGLRKINTPPLEFASHRFESSESPLPISPAAVDALRTFASVCEGERRPRPASSAASVKDKPHALRPQKRYDEVCERATLGTVMRPSAMMRCTGKVGCMTVSWTSCSSHTSTALAHAFSLRQFLCQFSRTDLVLGLDGGGRDRGSDTRAGVGEPPSHGRPHCLNTIIAVSSFPIMYHLCAALVD
jgi:hypothetical protein